MDDILGFIVFLLIAGISGAAKYMESRKAERERAERPTVRPEDLPEATRRALYGESGVPPRAGQRPGHDIPMARRKGAPPPMPPRRQPAEGPVMRQGNYEVRGEETTSPAYSEEQRVEELRRKLQQKLQQQWVEEQRKRNAAEQRKREVEKQRQAHRPVKAQQRQQPVPRPAPSAPTEGPRPVPPVPKRAEAAEPPQRRTPATATAARILHNPRSLRQAIILREVLSPPVGLR